MSFFDKYTKYPRKSKDGEPVEGAVIGRIAPQRFTPGIVLRSFLPITDDIEEMVVAVRMKDGNTQVVASNNLSIEFLAFAASTLQAVCTSLVTPPPASPRKA